MFNKPKVNIINCQYVKYVFLTILKVTAIEENPVLENYVFNRAQFQLKQK